MSENTTRVLGYFNGNRWPIQLVISKLNITLHLRPGEFILDKQGRKINDPFFETYAASRQLHREEGETEVPIIRIPQIVITPTIAQTTGHSVSAVTQFKMDSQGINRPVMPAPAPLVAVAVNASPHQGMTIEEARRRGLVRPIREVPESYGTPDHEGMPPTNAPEIKYAVEAHRNPASTSHLPPAVTQPEVLTRRIQPQQALKESTGDEGTGFLNRVVPSVPPGAEEVLPPPQLDAAPAPSTQAPAPSGPPRKSYICMADGRKFDFRSQLEAHVKRKFPGMYEQLMSAYPKED